MAVYTEGLLMGGSTTDAGAAADTAFESQLKSKYGSHVTKDWGIEHGIFTQAQVDAWTEDKGRYSDDYSDILSGFGSKIGDVETSEMTELDEQWAIDKRKTMKKGKTSLLSGGTTGLGVDANKSTSLLS